MTEPEPHHIKFSVLKDKYVDFLYFIIHKAHEINNHIILTSVNINTFSSECRDQLLSTNY